MIEAALLILTWGVLVLLLWKLVARTKPGETRDLGILAMRTDRYRKPADKVQRRRA
jgi:hypothetical protein